MKIKTPRNDLEGRHAFYIPAEVKSTGRALFRVHVLIVSARRAYGRDELLVAPVDGSGRAWVRLGSLEVTKPVRAGCAC